MEHAGIGGDAKVQRQEAVVESTPVPDVSNDAEDRDQEHQRIEHMVGGERCAPVELANVRRQVRRPIEGAPKDPCDDQRDLDEPDAAKWDIDPERPRRARDVVEEEPKGTEKNDQRRNNPVEGDCGRS